MARWLDGVWRQATVVKIEARLDGSKAIVVSAGVEEAMVDLNDVT